MVGLIVMTLTQPSCIYWFVATLNGAAFTAWDVLSLHLTVAPQAMVTSSAQTSRQHFFISTVRTGHDVPLSFFRIFIMTVLHPVGEVC
jgi:hypothetical protein